MHMIVEFLDSFMLNILKLSSSGFFFPFITFCMIMFSTSDSMSSSDISFYSKLMYISSYISISNSLFGA